MAVDVSRRTFVQASAAAGTVAALGGPMSALGRAEQGSEAAPQADGYGPLQPTPEQDSGLALPRAARGLHVPADLAQRRPDERRQPDAGHLRRHGRLPGPGAGPRSSSATTRTARAPARSPWSSPPASATTRTRTSAAATRSSSSAATASVDERLRGARRHPHELRRRRDAVGHVDHLRGDLQLRLRREQHDAAPGVPHGYSFEMPADATGPVRPQPILDAGRFAHEAVAWLDGALYQTEDRGDACLVPLPARRAGRASRATWRRSAARCRRSSSRAGRTSTRTSRRPARRYTVEWVDGRRAQPARRTPSASRRRPRARRSSTARRACGPHGERVYFDCTTGGEAQLGQLWEYRPRGATAAS